MRSCGCNANQNIVFTNEHRRETSHKVHMSLLWETFGGGRHLQFLQVYDYLSCINTAVNFNRPPEQVVGHDLSMSCGGNIRNSGLLHKRPWRETEGSQSNCPPWRDHPSAPKPKPFFGWFWKPKGKPPVLGINTLKGGPRPSQTTPPSALFRFPEPWDTYPVHFLETYWGFGCKWLNQSP